MPRRGENIYKRKDGRWEGRILQNNGTYHYIYGKTYRQVREKKVLVQQGVPSSKTKLETPQSPVSALFDDWLKQIASARVKPSTYENYSRCMDGYIAPFFRQEQAGILTRDAVERFVQSVLGRGDLSTAYQKKILSIFKTALRDILKEQSDSTSILEKVRLPRVESKEIQVFSLSEQRLVENAVWQWEDRRALGILICFYSGIRLGELCALRWTDIDLDAGTMSISRTVTRTSGCPGLSGKTTLLVGTPKSKRSVRKIPLPEFLISAVRAYEKASAQGTCYLLTNAQTPLDPRSYQKLFTRVLKHAGVKNRKFHAIRHTFATRALELGVDVKTLSELLGHSNVSTTLNIYAHSLLEQKRIAMDKFEQLHQFQMCQPLFAVREAVISAQI